MTARNVRLHKIDLSDIIIAIRMESVA